jgi:hypothetical protein
MAIDATSVYWTECGDPTGGAVQKVSKAGGPIVTLATGNLLSGIAVGGTNVYWVTGASAGSRGAIMTVPVVGGTPTVVAPQSGDPAHLVVDASNAYWTEMNQGAVLRVPLSGGSPATVASAMLPSAIALDDTAVVWLGGQGVYAAPKTGGSAVALASSLPLFPTNGLAVNATDVYVNAGAPSELAGVDAVPVGGGAFRIVYGGQFSAGGGPIAVDATRVYWSEPTGVVYAGSLGGGNATVLATGQDNVDAIAVDDTAVYWLVNGSGAEGGVVKLPLSAIAGP